MTESCGRIAALVMEIQNDFLNTPGQRMTLLQAQQRFHMDAITCEAVLSALIDAKVLTNAPDGAYRRFFPRLTVRSTVANSRRRNSDGQSVAGFAA